MNLKVDSEWDWRMRFVSHVAIIVLIALFSGLALGGPQLLLVTLPAGAIVLAFEMRRLQRDRKEVGIMTDAGIPAKRRRRAIVLAISIAVFAIGLLDVVPQDLHDDYWYLFVAPSMIAFIVGVVALLMLGWTYMPRRVNDTMSSP